MSERKVEPKKNCARNGGQAAAMEISVERKLKLCVCLSICCFLFSFAPEIFAAEKIRVAFVSPTPVFAPAWIAKETGLFAKHGLDADVVLLTGSPRLVQALIAGDVDYAMAGSTALMRARMQSAELAVLAASTNISVMKLLVSRQSGVRRLEDLKGKIIGVSQYGSDADAFARIVLDKAGLKPDKDVPIMQLGGHPQVATALAAGKLEAGVLGGLALLTAKKSGALVLADGVKLNSIAMAGTLAAMKRTLQRSRDSVLRFMRAHVEGFQYFRSNRDGAVAIIQKYMGGLAADQARFLYDEYVELFEEFPVPREKAFQEVLDHETDPKAKNFKPADFVDLSYLTEIDRSGRVEKIYKK
jgi:ABC-type nitrate/sulfonate/bicarbonate transport system substrate-binding protein